MTGRRRNLTTHNKNEYEEGSEGKSDRGAR
jgi:hypothetical protein